MTPEQIAEVWSVVDRGYLAEVARRGPSPVFATISGAHLYGFASRDSDIDLRGAFLLPTREVLGLWPSQETVSLEDKSRFDLDWVAHDLRKFSRLLVSHNGYVLEQLYSPLIVLSTPAFEELRELGRRCITRPTVRHYLGFARGRRQRLREPEASVKHLLYAYRVLLTGIHLMRTGDVDANLPSLNRKFELTYVSELIERKREGSEAMRLLEDELLEHERRLDDLEVALVEAHDRSELPLEPIGQAPLDDFVVRTRLASLDSQRS